MDNRKINILIISDRSNYFSFLGSRLEEEYKVEYIAVRDKDEEILRRKGKEFISFSKLENDVDCTTADEIIDEAEIKKILLFDLRRDELYNNGLGSDLIIKKGLKYSVNISKIIEANKISLVIVQNDSVGHSAVTIAVCRKKKVKTLIFEDGFFRPNTVVVDEKGVNINNSCPRQRDFYETITIDQKRFDDFIRLEKSKASRPQISYLNLIRYILGTIKYPHRLLTLYYEIKIFVDDCMYQRRDLRDYVFLPLQVRTDTQILCHSSVRDMREVIDICISALEKYNKRTKKPLALVIKDHPKDECLAEVKRHIKRSEVKVFFLKRADTKSLIEKSSLVITVNSTVGIEGLLYHKPVITIGRAFYSIDGIAYNGDNFGTLDLVIEKAVNAPVRHDIINKFLYYLKFSYQVDGYLDSPDGKNILPVVARVRTILRR